MRHRSRSSNSARIRGDPLILRAIAATILEEIEDERRWDRSFERYSDLSRAVYFRRQHSFGRWDRSFERYSDLLAKLAAEAMTEHHAGKTQELDPETL
jgi:hypothetical protein